MNITIEQFLQFIVLLGTVISLFYRVITLINKQAYRLEELYKSISKFESYERELAITKQELIELKAEIKSIKQYMNSIEENLKELRQEKALLLKLLEKQLNG